jgi:hypothetical protein
MCDKIYILSVATVLLFTTSCRHKTVALPSPLPKPFVSPAWANPADYPSFQHAKERREALTAKGLKPTGPIKDPKDTISWMLRDTIPPHKFFPASSTWDGTDDGHPIGHTKKTIFLD